MSLVTPRFLDDALYAQFETHKHVLGGSLESFSETALEVARQQMSGTEAVFFSTDPNVLKRMEANGKKLRRQQLDRTDRRMPVRFLPVFIAAMKRLCAQAGAAAATEVCASIGSFYVPFPEPGAIASRARLGAVMKRVGEVMDSSADIVEDGSVNVRDRPAAPAAIVDVDELIAAALAYRAQLQTLIDLPPAAL